MLNILLALLTVVGGIIVFGVLTVLYGIVFNFASKALEYLSYRGWIP